MTDRVGFAVRPRGTENGERMLYRYRLYTVDGDEAGDTHYAVLIKPGETIWTGDGRKLRVVNVVPTRSEDDSPYVGLLRVESA